MAITKEVLEQWAERHNYHRDKWGYYQKSRNGKEYRLRLSKIAVRVELKIHHDGTQYSRPSTEWIRLWSRYFKNLSIKAIERIA